MKVKQLQGQFDRFNLRMCDKFNADKKKKKKDN